MTHETSYIKGISVFHTKPGALNRLHCEACGSECIVERSVFGPTSWAEAMAKKGHLHDVFRCPNVTYEWHRTAEILAEEMLFTSSNRLQDLIRQDLIEYLRDHGVSYGS